jgi:hypothetical protein
MKIPKPILGSALKAYFMEHVKPIPQDTPGFYRVTRPLHVFKSTHQYRDGAFCITNLMIPKGAFIYAPDICFAAGHQPNEYHHRKMRASSASVHSNFTKRTKERVQEASSCYSPIFKYKEGTKVKPQMPFSHEPHTCDYGIHFFLNLYDAYNY